MSQALAPTLHTDTFTRDRLPPKDQWPVFVLIDPKFNTLSSSIVYKLC
jgi:2-aminobenzoate-CoA ligase